MVKKCCVYLCNSRAPHVTLYAIPSKPDLKKAWFDAIGLSVTEKKTACVCSKHFETTDFWPRYASGRISLRPNVVPSKFLNRDLAVSSAKVTAVAATCARRKQKNLKKQVSRQTKQITPDEDRTNPPEPVSSVPVDQAPQVLLTPYITSQGRQTDKVITVENDNLKVEEKDAISETKLPDGSVCEFYSTCLEEENSTSDDSSNNSEPLSPKTEPVFPSDDILQGKEVELNQSTVRKRKASDDPLARLDGLRSAKTLAQVDVEECQKDGASSKSAGMDFEAISRALEQDEIKLPSPQWSHTRLGQSLIIFLCWDKDLRLVKKAILRKGSQMSLYLGDHLLADGSTQDSIFDLEGCLRLLDMFEQCKGLNGKNCTWSENCAKYIYITDGNQICNACRTDVVVYDANSVDTAVSVVAAAPREVPASSFEHEGLNAVRNSHFKIHQAPESLGFTSKFEGAVTSPSVYPGQNVMIESTAVTTNSQYLVVDFVVSGDGITTPSIQPSVLKKPSLALAPKSRKRKRKQATLKDRTTQQAVRKPTARKSTGGPRKCLTSIGKTLPIHPELAVPVEDEMKVGITKVAHCSESTPTDSSEISPLLYQINIEKNLPIDTEPDASKPFPELAVSDENKMEVDITEVAHDCESSPTDLLEIDTQPAPVISTDGLKEEDPS